MVLGLLAACERTGETPPSAATAPAKALTGDNDAFCRICGGGTAEQVQASIRDGANVNARNAIGFTPLMEAALENPRPEVVGILLKAGAAVNAGNRSGVTALMLAARRNQKPDVIAALLKAGAEVNAKDDWGGTALAAAAMDNPVLAVTAALLAAKAEVNVKDKRGMTPLMAAACNRNSEITVALLKAGAEVNATSEDGTTALMMAAMGKNSNPEAIAALVGAGANVNARDKDGMTPLLFAAKYSENPAVIPALTKAGADGNARDLAGKTAAVFTREREDAQKALLERRAAELQAQQEIRSRRMQLEKPGLSTQPAEQAGVRESEAERVDGLDFSLVTAGIWVIPAGGNKTTIPLVLRVTNRSDKDIVFSDWATSLVVLKGARGETLPLTFMTELPVEMPPAMTIGPGQTFRLDRTGTLERADEKGEGYKLVTGRLGRVYWEYDGLKAGKYTVWINYENSPLANEFNPKPGAVPYWVGEAATKKMMIEIADRPAGGRSEGK